METIDSLKAEILSLRKQLKEKDKLISGLKLTIKKAEIGEPEESFQRPLKPPRRSLEVGQNILKDDDDEAGNNLRSQTGTIKALPRELSIFNSDDDDITQYSKDDGNLKVTENSEMRDAYNARGIYTGQVSRKHQLPHGRGRMVYHHQGRSYEGEWNTGHWHGFGVTQNAFGDCYEGQFVNDLKEGEGRLEYADGRVFEGLFKQDDAIKGTLVFSDGSKYVGELHNGCRHGYGTYYFLDGSRYEGESVNNFFEGNGKMIWPDGGWYQGEWSQGQIDGYGLEMRANGTIRHKGLWKNGVPVRNKG